MKIRKLQTLTEAVEKVIEDKYYTTVSPVYADAIEQSRNVRELIQKRFEERKLQMPNEDRNAHAEGVKSNEMKKMKLSESLFNEWVEDQSLSKEDIKILQDKIRDFGITIKDVEAVKNWLDNRPTSSIRSILKSEVPSLNIDVNQTEVDALNSWKKSEPRLANTIRNIASNDNLDDLIAEMKKLGLTESKEDGFQDNSETKSKTIGDIKADFDKELYNMFEGQVTYDGAFGVYMFETPDNNKETAAKIIEWLSNKYQLTCEEGEKGRVWVANLVFADDMGEEILDVQKYPVNHEKAPLMEKKNEDDDFEIDDDAFDMYDLIYSMSTRGGDANDVNAILKRIGGSNAVGYTVEDQFSAHGKYPITTSSDTTRLIVRVPTKEALENYTKLYDECKLEYKVKDNTKDDGEEQQYDRFIISVKIPMDPFDMPYCIGDYFKEKGLNLEEFMTVEFINKLARKDQLFANPDDNEAFLNGELKLEFTESNDGVKIEDNNKIVEEEITIDNNEQPLEEKKEILTEVRINTEGLNNFHPWGEKAIETWKLILENNKMATFESMLESMNDSGIVGSEELNSILENQKWVLGVLNIDTTNIKKEEKPEDEIVYNDDEELPMVYDDEYEDIV